MQLPFIILRIKAKNLFYLKFGGAVYEVQKGFTSQRSLQENYYDLQAELPVGLGYIAEALKEKALNMISLIWIWGIERTKI